MKVFLGIDLGSTTTKAAVVDERGGIVGRGLTHTRANFETACAVARAVALADARFALLPEALRERARALYAKAERSRRLGSLARRTGETAGDDAALRDAAARLFAALAGSAAVQDVEASFRDAVLSEASIVAERADVAGAVPYERLVGTVERALVADELDPTVLEPRQVLDDLAARGELSAGEPEALARAAAERLDVVAKGGTGYGRHRLPFEKSEIRSEILCHGLGARHAFAKTRTVLDIGGQDTKAIQLDEQGLVTSFQMNDRCAAGCGRYLGYVAEELSLPLPELAPLALASRAPSKINSTCTVFAGAEIRDRLALGEKREDVVAGLHRAIVLRAIGLLARSGGVRDELTFSGGVAKNGAVVRFLGEEVARTYGGVTLNVSPDGILNGAIGAALFARMEARAC